MECVTAGRLKQMSDDELQLAVVESRKVDFPNYLNDVADATQNFVYYIGLNSKPLLLDRKRFNEFMRDNNIPKNQIMSRVIRDDERHTAREYVEMLKYSEYNYIGGKYGGQGMGAGTYFEMNGGGPPHVLRVGFRPGTIINAVYNPATAKVIDATTLRMVARRLEMLRPCFCRTVGPYNDGGLSGKGNNMSLYELALGCNAIAQYYDENDVFAENAARRGEQCVIDRGALVILDE